MVQCFNMYDGRPIRYAVVSWIGSFTGVLSLFALTYAFEMIPGLKDIWITKNWVVGAAGAFGAQSVLVFALPANPASQPWNCVFGSMISAFIGVSIRKIFVALQQLGCPDSVGEDDFDCHSDAVQPDLLLIASALANSISIVVMHLTDSVHPPAGAFAYIAINAAAKIRSLGYFYIILPVGIGSVWFVTWSWFVNKYINMMIERLFCVDNEGQNEVAEKMQKLEKLKMWSNGVKGKIEQTNIPVQNGYSNATETPQSQNLSAVENADERNVNIVKAPSKPASRKYPSGNGIGGWIRPLRKK